jgi:hypothetical protein
MQSNHMKVMHMWSSFKILIEDFRLSSSVAVTVTKNRKLLSKTYFKIRYKASCHQALWKWCIYDPLSDLWLLTLVAYGTQQRTFHRCFLPSFGSFGRMVSEEKNLIFSIVFYILLIFCSFRPDPLTNMATINNSCFWFSKKSSPLKPLCQMNRNLVGGIYGRFSIRIAQFVPIINKHGRHRQLLFWLVNF